MKHTTTRFLLTLCLSLLVSASHAQNISFGMVTDVHYADIPDNGTRIYSQSLKKLRESIDTFNLYKAGFVIELGDLKDMNEQGSEAKTLVYLRKAESVLAGFRGRRYHVFGNHDMDCITKQQFGAAAGNSRVRGKNTWYSFDRGGIHFVVVDACFDSLGRDYSKGNFKWYDANIPERELTWLQNDLGSTMDPVIVFSHQLLDMRGSIAVRDAARVRQVLEGSKKVLCVFQGHYHEGMYSSINGIHYYTLRGMVEGTYPEGNSYALVRVTNKMISIQGFRRAVSLQLPVDIPDYLDDYRFEGDYDWEPWEEQQ